MNSSFDTEKNKYYAEFIIDSFKEHFRFRGYEEHQPVQINSKIDDSVYFIGSTISVFKKYLLSNTIDPIGYFLVQRCIRTQNIKCIYDDNKIPEWSSYFRSIGTISPYNRLNEVIFEVWEFLNKKLNIPKNDIKVRVSSTDLDLLKFWKGLDEGPIIEIDSKDLSYYKHKYGLEHINGRNLNFALRQNGSNQFKDIGNLIVIERNGNERIAVELAFGVSTIICRMFSLYNSVQASIISKIIPFDRYNVSKFSDALSVIVHLVREELTPTASNTRGRVLRSYIQGLIYLNKKLKINFDTIVDFADRYEQEEYGNMTGVGQKIYNYITKFSLD